MISGKGAMYIQNFNRYEIKYLITADTAEAFSERVSAHICPDEYGTYTISNIYLDTDDYYFISHSLQKPVYKEKLRIRRYGENGVPEKVFFEIKKKYKKIVTKRRISLSPHMLEDYLKNGTVPSCLETFTDRQIFSEIDYLMQKYSPVPKLYLAYDRKAYFMKEHPDVRITFDRNIRYRSDDLSLDTGSGCTLLDTGINDYRLIEIKAPGAIPKELVGILSDMKIYPTSFSKYGRIFSEIILPRRKDFTNV